MHHFAALYRLFICYLPCPVSRRPKFFQQHKLVHCGGRLPPVFTDGKFLCIFFIVIKPGPCNSPDTVLRQGLLQVVQLLFNDFFVILIAGALRPDDVVGGADTVVSPFGDICFYGIFAPGFLFFPKRHRNHSLHT